MVSAEVGIEHAGAQDTSIESQHKSEAGESEEKEPPEQEEQEEGTEKPRSVLCLHCLGVCR